MRILIIEECLSHNSFLEHVLEKEHFQIDRAQHEADGILLLRTYTYDLVILDTNIWEESNSSRTFKHVRSFDAHIPIVILSPECESHLRIAYLEAGADDFLTKPFCFKELAARIRAILRRPKKISGDILQIDDLSLDRRKHKVMRADQEIILTRKEFLLLEYLLRQPNIVITREKIFEYVWDIHADTFSKTVETHILSLRKKIETGNKKRLIHTVNGKGYKIAIAK